MSAQILSGKDIAQDIRLELKSEVDALIASGVRPGLGVILVGEDPASVSYVTAKERACEEIGIHSDDNRLPADVSQEDLLATIDRLNADPAIHGILVQLPLPDHIDDAAALLRVSPDKDVDGFHPTNVGRMVIGQDAFFPCTPHGVLQILTRSGVATKGKHVVVVGRSNIVGKPLANMLLRKASNGDATVTVCHSRSTDIASHTLQADIVVAAVGRPNTVTADMVREGAIVIDVGVNRVPDATKKRGYRLVGDVDYAGVAEKASMITPVPGGVGPLTIAMLLFNTVESAKRTSAGESA